MKTTIHERLQKALKHWDGGGVLDFRDAMKKALKGTGVHGYTHPAIKRYLDGTQPPEKWLQVAAEVLGVRFPWLAAEVGAMTEKEERVQVAAATMTLSGDLAREMHLGDKFTLTAAGEPLQSVLDALGVKDRAPLWVGAVSEVWKRMGGGETASDLIADTLKGTLKAFELEPEWVADDALDKFVFSMTPVLLDLVEERKKLDPGPAFKKRSTAQPKARR